MKNKKTTITPAVRAKIILGQLSELLTIIGSLLFVTLPQESWGSITGAVVAGAAILFALNRHDGVQSIFTLVRKFLSTLPAIGVQFGWIDASVGAKLIAALAPLSALIWSYLVNAGVARGPLPGAVKLLIFLLCLSPFLTSCGHNSLGLGMRSEVGFYKRASPGEPGAEFGAFISKPGLVGGLAPVPVREVVVLSDKP